MAIEMAKFPKLRLRANNKRKLVTSQTKSMDNFKKPPSEKV